jgi:hypothetical protein
VILITVAQRRVFKDARPITELGAYAVGRHSWILLYAYQFQAPLGKILRITGTRIVRRTCTLDVVVVATQTLRRYIVGAASHMNLL